MYHTSTDHHESHWEAIFAHLRACDQHLKAMGMPAIFEEDTFLQKYEQALTAMRDSCGCCCCCAEDEDDTSAPIQAESDGTACLIIPCADFEQLFQDMVTMHDMLDYLIGLQEKKTHLAKTLKGVAEKLAVSDAEQRNICSITDRMEAIADRWANLDFEPVETP